MSAKPTCLIVASASPQGGSVSLHRFMYHQLMKGINYTGTECSIHFTDAGFCQSLLLHLISLLAVVKHYLLTS